MWWGMQIICKKKGAILGCRSQSEIALFDGAKRAEKPFALCTGFSVHDTFNRPGMPRPRPKRFIFLGPSR